MTSSLNEAIFRLGQVSADKAITNASLLRQLSDIAVETLGVEVLVLGVFEKGVECPSTDCCIRGPWTREQGDAYLEQTNWHIDERALAKRLAGLRRGRLYHRPELNGERDALPASPFDRPMNQGDQAMALYRRSDGVELLLCLHKTEGSGPFPRTTLARAGALAPYIAQCWAQCWRREPAWMASLKPQGRAILEALLAGFDDDQIAQRTGLSYHSVRAHLKRLFREAGVRSRLHLMQAFKQCGEGSGLMVEFPEEAAQQAV